MRAIYDRELDSQFNGLTGYIFGAFVLLFTGIYVMAINLNGYTNFEYVLYSMSFILLIAIPILTMRSIAEERRQHTDQLLYSLPMSMTKIVLGKYFALLTVFAVPVVVMALYPLVLTALATSGAIAYRAAYSALVGFFFLGAALVAIGLFISSLTENVGVAAGICFVVMLLLYFMGDLANYISTTTGASLAAFAIVILLVGVLLWRMTKNLTFAGIVTIVLEAALVICFLLFQSSFSGLFADVVNQLALFDRFYNFRQGIFDIKALVYYVSVTATVLFLTVQVMEKRRYA